MAEIKIPDELTHDCEKCQGLCCIANKHEVDAGFPIPLDKPAGMPCMHLEFDPANLATLFQCKIHGSLKKLGWKVCAGFSCYGAGQSTTAFFEEMGVRWVDEPPDSLDEEQWDTRILNFQASYLVLSVVFRFLPFIKERFGDTAFNEAKAAVQNLMPEFSREVERTDTTIDPLEWLEDKFNPAILEAVEKNTGKTIITRREDTPPSSEFVPASRLSGQSKS
jgi:hypothetical protein